MMTSDSYNHNLIHQTFNSSLYELLEKVGEGGFGHVYRAKKINTGQIVAIKFLSLSDGFDNRKKQNYIERFEREALLNSRLQHPNIVRLLDKGHCDNNLLYAVFEYVDGATLKQTLIDHGSLSPLETAEIMAQVLDALAYAHSQGIIHRDIKPDNIMLSHIGTKTHVKVLDFGIGTLAHEARQMDFKSITLTQETLGTPSYSAPEQLRGEPPTVKTDLYVWGLVFIECLTGQAAISGLSLAAVFHKQLSASNVPLPAAIISHPVSALLRRVLQKKAHERAGNAADIYHELKQLNFSSLVGELNTPGKKNLDIQSSPSTTSHYDKTQINSNSILPTEFTECKQISVLCLSLTIQSVTDAEIDTDIVDALHSDQKSQCIDIAIRYGAFHVGTLGDTLLFYFGYPVVSDNDSRLCARTALEISSSLNKRNALFKTRQGVELLAQMGMHTGIVTHYSDMPPEGKTPNMAMELARYALPKQILCSDSSKKLLDCYLNFKSEKTNPIGIRQQGLALHSLVGEHTLEAIGFLRGNRANFDFVGRQEELTSLKKLLNSTSDNSTAHIHGDAGIGKSRLVFELRNQATNLQHYIVQCLPEQKYNALYPILSILKHQYSLDSLSPPIATKKLRAYLSEATINATLPILCAWLHLPVPEDLSPIALSPDKQKYLLFDTLTTLLITQTNVEEKNQRRLFILEDMHWADPTTIEFIASFIGHPDLKRENHIFISTSRNPLPEQLKTLNISSLEIKRLNLDKTNEFIIKLFDKQNVSAAVVDVITSRTDGIPLFIEELVNMLKAKKIVQHLNGFVDFVSQEKIDEIPETLLESLQQKLDSLYHAKGTAQLAATIGRRFQYDLLVAISKQSEEQIQADLNELIDKELIYKQRQIDGDNYIFKHALIRDAAYENIATSSKKSIHFHLADVLETKFTKKVHDFPYMVGKHWELADQPGKASISYIRAGDNSSNTFAVNEAISYYQQAIQQLELNAEKNIPEKNYFALAYTGLADNLSKKGEQEEARHFYNKALNKTHKSPLNQVILHSKIGKSWETHHKHNKALEEYNKAETIINLSTDKINDEYWLEEWLNIQSSKLHINYWQGNVDVMSTIIEKVNPIIAEKGNAYQKARFYADTLNLRVRQRRFNLVENDVKLAHNYHVAAIEANDTELIAASSFTVGFALYFSGQYKSAEPALLNALEQLSQLNDITMRSRCLTYITIMYRRMGNLSNTEQYALEALEASTAAGMDDYIAAAKANLAWLAYKNNNIQKAINLITECNSIWRALSKDYPFPLQWLSLLIELDLIDKNDMTLGGNDKDYLRKTQIVKLLLDNSQQMLLEAVSNPLTLFLQETKEDIQSTKRYLSNTLLNAKKLAYL